MRMKLTAKTVLFGLMTSPLSAAAVPVNFGIIGDLSPEGYHFGSCIPGGNTPTTNFCSTHGSQVPLVPGSTYGTSQCTLECNPGDLVYSWCWSSGGQHPETLGQPNSVKEGHFFISSSALDHPAVTEYYDNHASTLTGTLVTNESTIVYCYLGH